MKKDKPDITKIRTDGDLIDALKVHLGCGSDNRVAYTLGIDPAAIYNMRAGRRNFGSGIRLRAYSLMGCGWAREAEQILGAFEVTDIPSDVTHLAAHSQLQGA